MHAEGVGVMRIGLIGASRVATFAVIEPAGALADVEVVAVAARSAGRARTYAVEHGIATVFDSYEALYTASEIDLIYIGTPPAVHLDQALAAIAAGKHLLIEKPVAMDAPEAARIHDAAAAAGVQAFEAMHSLHHPLFARLASLLPEIGQITAVEARFDAAVGTAPGEFRWDAGLGGGALMDLGVYPLAWCRRLLGEAFTVERATARWSGTVDVDFAADLSFAGGATAHVAAAMDAPRHEAELTITGEQGRITVVNPLAPQRGNAITVETADRRWTETVDGPSSYLAQLTAVRDAIAGTAPFPLASDDYVHSMAAIDRVRAALPR